jgi:3-methyladenine DNA glycosylase AlkD
MIIKAVRQALREKMDARTAENGQRYFKEEIQSYGVKTGVVRKISKAHESQIKSMVKSDVWAVCEMLWQSGMLEESFIACHWSYAMRKQFTVDDFTIFERWVERYVSNWASCDTLCNHTIGTLVEMFPNLLKDLRTWAKSEKRWMRRAAAVTMIVPARHGKFLDDIFAIADILLMDQDDLVQKGYGWMLKAASKGHQQAVYDYVMADKDVMPRTALRYAVEKMPEALRAQAMAK